MDIAVRFNHLVISPILGFAIKTKEGVTIYGTNSYLLDCTEFQCVGEQGTVVTARLQFQNHLSCGDYFISLGVASRQGEDIVPHDRRYDSIHLVVAPTSSIYGFVDLGLTMKINRVPVDVPA
ncbi:hypothetical protein D9M73_259910 [compost metagenome]